MTRVKISVWILVVILGVCILSVLIVRNRTNAFINRLDNVQECVDAEKTDEAVELAEELSEYCICYCKGIGILVNREKTTEIRSAVMRVKPLIERESEEINAEIESIKGMLEQLRRRELPMIYNIF